MMPDKIIDLTEYVKPRPHGATPDEWAHFDLILGLTDDLLPVVSNPDAKISPHSKMTDLGKTPSQYNRAGFAAGVPDWTSYVATSDDVGRWAKNSDLGICLQTRCVRAIDVDVADPVKSERISSVIDSMFPAVGRPPIRLRPNSGKFLIAFTMPGDYTKRKFEVDGGIVEFLATGQQFVAIGRHASGVHYEWAGGLPDEFPVVTPEKFEAVFAALVDEFAIGEVSVAGQNVNVDRSVRIEGVTDPVVDILRDRGMIKSTERDGRLNVVCPWQHEHTDGLAGAESSTQYMPAGVGRHDPGFECLHAHCMGRNVGDFYNAIGYEVNVADDFEAIAPEVDQTGATIPAPRPLPAFDRDQNGFIKATLANINAAVRRDDFTGARVAYDEFRDEIMISEDGGINWRPFIDADYVRLRHTLERRGFKPVSADKIKDVVIMIADEVKFDSAKLWASRLQWDGVNRIDKFFAHYFNAADDDYSTALSRYLWSALAGRLLEPGIKVDMVPILVGDQGIGKSTAIAAMVPSEDLFTEITFHDKDEDNARKLRGKLIAEIGELRGLHTKEIESIKAFITRIYEHFVPKYREFAVQFPRRNVFVGTTNRDEFLADPTGNRRFCPINVGKVLINELIRDREQIWAEAINLFTVEGIMWHEAESLAKDQHDKFKLVDEWESIILKWINDDFPGIAPGEKGYVTTNEILIDCLKIPSERVNRANQTRVGDIMKNLGFAKKRFSEGEVRVWGYLTSDTLDTLDNSETPF